ncbi:MAG: class I SAM-dependent methyltransferase, partial [Isosphaeraceae bacterium]|nr:class I SAM-dependent methyltransferase [Isosphaeraceae bacterium]
MRDAVLEYFESFPDPSPVAVPIEPNQLDRIDDYLHYGWSWHRYRYCYRYPERLRILDAGCGTGLTTLGLARLNPGAAVLGLDASPRSLELAARRAETVGRLDVDFRQHDLDTPLPGGLGPFDFVVCRRVLGLVADPVRVLEHLARALDDRGLLLATFPAREGRRPIRQMRRAVEVLSTPAMGPTERADLGLELFRLLRPDHPIRQFETRHSGPAGPNRERFLRTYLGPDERDWDLADAIATLEQAGLKFLYVATGRPWRPDLAFLPGASESLQNRVADLSDQDRALLI